MYDLWAFLYVASYLKTKRAIVLTSYRRFLAEIFTRIAINRRKRLPFPNEWGRIPDKVTYASPINMLSSRDLELLS